MSTTSKSKTTATRTLSATLFLLTGLGAGVACTAATSGPAKRALPKAGASDDDGTGVLARWSRGESGVGGVQGCSGDDCGGNGAYGEDYYGEDGYGGYGGYGGGYYGGGYYGGSYDQYGQLKYPYPQYSPPPQQVANGYTITTVHNGGVIEGTISWKTAPKAPATIGPFADADGTNESRCGTTLPNPTLALSAAKGVGHTVVYLADIRVGKAPLSVGGTIEQKGCTFAPHLQVAGPIGIVLQMVNRDNVKHPITVRKTAPNTKDVVRNLALPAGAQKDATLDSDGFYEVTGHDDHPAALGWIIVPPNPYYVVTDVDGYFRLDDVPPGEYTLVAWHEPVATGTDAATGTMQRGNPVEIRTRVKVSAGGTTLQNLDLK